MTLVLRGGTFCVANNRPRAVDPRQQQCRKQFKAQRSVGRTSHDRQAVPLPKCLVPRPAKQMENPIADQRRMPAYGWNGPHKTPSPTANAWYHGGGRIFASGSGGSSQRQGWEMGVSYSVRRVWSGRRYVGIRSGPCVCAGVRRRVS